MYNPYRITNRATRGEFVRRSLFWPAYAIVYTCRAPHLPENINVHKVDKKNLATIVAMEGFKLFVETALILTTYEAICNVVQKL